MQLPGRSSVHRQLFRYGSPSSGVNKMDDQIPGRKVFHHLLSIKTILPEEHNQPSRHLPRVSKPYPLYLTRRTTPNYTNIMATLLVTQ